MKNVYVIGSYSTRFKRWLDSSFKDLTKNAYLGVLRDAGMESGDEIEFAYFGNFAMHHWGQGNIRGQVCFIPLVREGLFPERIPIINVEGACSTASMAFHLAWKDILSGQSHVALAIGVEKLNLPVDRELNFEMLNDGLDRLDFQETIDVYKKAAEVCGRTFAPEKNRTLPMDTYAIQACYHMWRYGTTQRQLAIAASKSHFYGSMNPNAHYQFECSVEAVLGDRLISYPFTRAMCCPVSDGAAAALLCSDDYLKSLPRTVQNRAVKIKASVMSGGKYRAFDEPSLTRIAADKAYQAAGS